MLAEDDSALKNVTSAELSYGHSGGVMEDQEQSLAVFAAKKTGYKTWEISDQTITFHGKDLAIVRHHVNSEIAGANGQINKLDIGLLMIWTKEKGEWKLLARQAFRTPPAQ